MEEFMIKGHAEKEQLEKIKDFAEKEDLEFILIKKDQVVKVLPKNVYLQENLLQADLLEEDEKVMIQTVEEFFEIHAPSFKENDVEIPSYFQFELDSEYDDNGGSYLYLSSLYFYDENKNHMTCDFEVATKYGKENVEELLREQLQDITDSNRLDELFSNQQYIPISKGE